jgi:hypothetical protein
MHKGSFHCRTKFMFVVAGVPFDSGMSSRNPTTARWLNSSILGENFRERICEDTVQQCCLRYSCFASDTP